MVDPPLDLLVEPADLAGQLALDHQDVLVDVVVDHQVGEREGVGAVAGALVLVQCHGGVRRAQVLAVHRRHGEPQEVRSPGVVAVEERDIAATGVLQAAVAGGADAGPVLGDHPDPLVACRPFREHPGRVVRGPVVHHDQLPVLQGLRADRLERQGDDAWPVADRDHHAHQWLPVHALRERRRGPLRAPPVLGLLVPVVEHPGAGVLLLLTDQPGSRLQGGSGRAPGPVRKAGERRLVVGGRQEEPERPTGVRLPFTFGGHRTAVEQRPETSGRALAAQVAEQRSGLAPGERVAHPSRQQGRVEQRVGRVTGAGLAEEVSRRRRVGLEGLSGERLVERPVDDAGLDEPVRALARRFARARLAGRRRILAGPKELASLQLCPHFLAPHTLRRWASEPLPGEPVTCRKQIRRTRFLSATCAGVRRNVRPPWFSAMGQTPEPTEPSAERSALPSTTLEVPWTTATTPGCWSRRPSS